MSQPELPSSTTFTWDGSRMPPLDVEVVTRENPADTTPTGEAQVSQAPDAAPAALAPPSESAEAPAQQPPPAEAPEPQTAPPDAAPAPSTPPPASAEAAPPAGEEPAIKSCEDLVKLMDQDPEAFLALPPEAVTRQAIEGVMEDWHLTETEKAKLEELLRVVAPELYETVSRRERLRNSWIGRVAVHQWNALKRTVQAGLAESRGEYVSETDASAEAPEAEAPVAPQFVPTHAAVVGARPIVRDRARSIKQHFNADVKARTYKMKLPPDRENSYYRTTSSNEKAKYVLLTPAVQQGISQDRRRAVSNAIPEELRTVSDTQWELSNNDRKLLERVVAARLPSEVPGFNPSMSPAEFRQAQQEASEHLTLDDGFRQQRERLAQGLARIQGVQELSPSQRASHELLREPRTVILTPNTYWSGSELPQDTEREPQLSNRVRRLLAKEAAVNATLERKGHVNHARVTDQILAARERLSKEERALYDERSIYEWGSPEEEQEPKEG